MTPNISSGTHNRFS